MLLDCHVGCYHGYVCMSWGPQILSSWRGEWLECLHAYGTFKFQVTFRVEGHQLGYVTHSKEGGSLNETLNVSYSLHACCSVALVLLFAGNGRAGENGLNKRVRVVELPLYFQYMIA